MPFVLYSKPGCHLCEDVREQLARLKVSFEERDITADDAWFQRYRYLIPVLQRADGACLEAPIDSETLARFVHAG